MPGVPACAWSTVHQRVPCMRQKIPELHAATARENSAAAPHLSRASSAGVVLRCFCRSPPRRLVLFCVRPPRQPIDVGQPWPEPFSQLALASGGHALWPSPSRGRAPRGRDNTRRQGRKSRRPLSYILVSASMHSRKFASEDLTTIRSSFPRA